MTKWINIYRARGNSYDAVVYGYESAAIKNQDDIGFVKTITVEIDEDTENRILESNYDKLVGFVTRLAARTDSKDNLGDTYDARALLYEIGRRDDEYRDEKFTNAMYELEIQTKLKAERK